MDRKIIYQSRFYPLISRGYRSKRRQKKGFLSFDGNPGYEMVGVEGFELSTSCSQSKRATGLRHTPNLSILPNRAGSGQSVTIPCFGNRQSVCNLRMVPSATGHTGAATAPSMRNYGTIPARAFTIGRSDESREPSMPDRNESSFPYFLMLTTTLCGGLVMVIEVLGARVIGPYFGVSLYVWTALITVTLLSLSAGYALGGHLSDKYPAPAWLYGLIMAAGMLVLLVPTLKPWAIQASVPLGLRGGALASATLLFAPALLLLGCVSPYVVRIAARELASLGRTVGVLYSLSTIGSMVGTALAGYVIIGFVGVSRAFHLCGTLLILIGLAYFVFYRRQWSAIGGVALLTGLLWLPQPDPAVRGPGGWHQGPPDRKQGQLLRQREGGRVRRAADPDAGTADRRTGAGWNRSTERTVHLRVCVSARIPAAGNQSGSALGPDRRPWCRRRGQSSAAAEHRCRSRRYRSDRGGDGRKAFQLAPQAPGRHRGRPVLSRPGRSPL